MIRCQHCGEEVEAGKQFCPYCGKYVSGEVVESHQVPIGAETSAPERAAAARDSAAPASRPAPMSAFERSKVEADGSRRTIFIVVALVSAVLAGGLIWWAMRPSAPPAEPRLEGALRPGTPEFEPYRDRIVLEFDQEQHAGKAARPLGDVVVRFAPIIRNFTGRTISGLELRAVILNSEKQPIRQRTFVRQMELAPNKVLTDTFIIEGLKPEEIPDNIMPGTLNIELTGVRFK